MPVRRKLPPLSEEPQPRRGARGPQLQLVCPYADNLRIHLFANPLKFRQMEKQHMEVVVELRHGASSQIVTDWLAQFGLEVMPLAVGLLAMGDATSVRSAFGPGDPIDLAVPDALREHVEYAAIVPPKHFYESPL